MIITLSGGIKCEAGDFILRADPARDSEVEANLILKTKTELPISSFVAPGLIQGPGEYEISGVRVKGIELAGETTPGHLRTAYLAELEGMRLAFLGELTTLVSDEVLDKLGEVGILFLDADLKKFKEKQLAALIKQIDPIIIIPPREAVTKLLSEELGQKLEPQSRLGVKKKNLTSEAGNKLVWLKAK